METKNTPHLPFLSIIVPVYNGAQTVEKCVESLLAQDYPKDRLEIIFVDNQSKDRTLQVLQPYAASGKILLLSETNVLNAYGARNTGIRAAKGDILAFTDSDCEAEPDWIRELMVSFCNPLTGCVAGEIVPAKASNVFEKYGGEGFLSQRKGVGLAFPPVKGGNCGFLKHVLVKIGFFREDYPSGGDTELAWRMVQQTKMNIEVNLHAIVKHHNVSSLPVFFRQYMRYGTHIYLFTKLPSGLSQSRPSFLKVLINTVTYFMVFIKRVLLVCFHRTPSSISKLDQDIYLMGPVLRVLTEWAVWWGYRFAVKNPSLLR